MYITDKNSAGISLFNQGYSQNPTTSASATTGTGYNDPSLATMVGQKFQTSGGQTVALASNGAVAVVAGVLVQSEAEITAFEKLAMTVPAAYPATAGLFQFLVTNGTTVLNVNKYQGGYAIVAAGTGIGQMFRIASHQPAANGATFVVTTEDAIVTTLDATSKITLQQNPYANILINPTTATASPVGVTLYAMAASTAPTYNATSGALTTAGVLQYGWIVTHGFVSCLVDNSVTNVGYPIGRSPTTAGTVGVATLTTTAQIGVSAQTLTSAQNGMINLFL